MLIFAFLYYMSSAQSDSYEFLNRFSEIGSVFSGGSEKSTNLSGRMGAWDAISTYIDTHPWGTVLPPQTVLNESPEEVLKALGKDPHDWAVQLLQKKMED